MHIAALPKPNDYINNSFVCFILPVMQAQLMACAKTLLASSLSRRIFAGWSNSW